MLCVHMLLCICVCVCDVVLYAHVYVYMCVMCTLCVHVCIVCVICVMCYACVHVLYFCTCVCTLHVHVCISVCCVVCTQVLCVICIHVVCICVVCACMCMHICVCVFPWCSASIISDRAEPHKHTCMVTKTGTPAFSLLWASPIFKLSPAPAHTGGWRAELRGHVLGSASGAAFLSSQRCHGAWASLHPSTSPHPVS